MSNSQHGYKWTKSFVFLEATNGERLDLIRLVAELSLLPPQRGAEFERTRSVCNTDNWKQLLCILYNPTGNTVPTAF